MNKGKERQTDLLTIGMMFIMIGVVSLIISLLTLVILRCIFTRKEKQIREQVWREYR